MRISGQRRLFGDSFARNTSQSNGHVDNSSNTSPRTITMQTNIEFIESAVSVSLVNIKFDHTHVIQVHGTTARYSPFPCFGVQQVNWWTSSRKLCCVGQKSS